MSLIILQIFRREHDSNSRFPIEELQVCTGGVIGKQIEHLKENTALIGLSQSGKLLPLLLDTIEKNDDAEKELREELEKLKQKGEKQ